MSSEYFVRITPEGAVQTVSTENPCLDWYYDQIGCTSIETVPLADTKSGKSVMIVDEECLIKPDPIPNAIASYLIGYPICGNVLIGGIGDRNGEPDIVGFDKSEITAHRLTIHIILTQRGMFEETS